MKIVNLGLFGLATIFFAIAANAREASLLSFDHTSSPELAVPAFDPPLDVNVALKAHWAALGSHELPKSHQNRIQFPERRRQARPVPLASLAFEYPGPRYSCQSARYWPTWWLRPEIEARRAAYFSNMAAVACEYSIPVGLLDAVIAQESGYKPWAISNAGAMGMMQIMPGTAQQLGLAAPWDGYANMRAGAQYLRQQLDRFGRVDLALAAYNAGPERRSLASGYIPAIAETRNYVSSITTNWLRLTQLEQPGPGALERAAAASSAVRASGYREVSLTVYDGMNAANPI